LVASHQIIDQVQVSVVA